MHDFRFVILQWLKNPGLAALTVLTLALATASCTGIRRSEGRDALSDMAREPFARPATVPVLSLRSVEPGTDRTDLAPLRTIIGNARVVALGQPALGVHESLAFRNRLLEYLVEELGFTAIAVESAFPESRRLSDYVLGGPGTAEEVLTETRTWWHEPLEENLQLVRWLRAHNADPSRNHPVRFYAIDLSYTGPWGSRPTPAALHSALAYLGRVDPPSARALGVVFEPWLSRLANPMVPWTTPEHDAFTAAVDDLVALLERERVAYLAAAPAADYEWAYRGALVAQQADRMFRVAPTDPPGARVPPSAWRMVNARDAAMAENVLWALGQEGPTGRVLIVTHYLHAQSAPTMGGPWDAFERMPTAMGQFLRASLGDGLVVIGLSEAATVERYVKSTAAFDAVVTVEALTPGRASGGTRGPDGGIKNGVK